MDILLTLLQIPILIVLIKYIRGLHSDALFLKSYYYILSFKVTAGLILGYIYFSYYKYGDTIDFLAECEVLSVYSRTNFIDYLKFILFGDIRPDLSVYSSFAQHPRVAFFIRVISPFFILTGSNYWILSIYLSLFSFLGFWILSNTIIKLYKLNSLAVLISFFLVPSVVFWSSGFMKESLVMGMMCWVITIALEFVHHKTISITEIFSVFFFSYVVLTIKFYYFGALVVSFFPYCLVMYVNNRFPAIEKSRRIRWLSYVLLIIGMVFIASMLHPLLNIQTLSVVVYKNYFATRSLTTGGNGYVFEGLSANPESFVKHLPNALIKGLFGPFIWDCKKIISMLSAIENTVLLVLMIPFTHSLFTTKTLSNIKLIEVSAALYIIVLAVFMAFSSPNWGTLVRYKVGYLPFFVLLLLNKSPFIGYLEKKFIFLANEEKKA